MARHVEKGLAMMGFPVRAASVALVSTALMSGAAAESGPTVSVSGGVIRGMRLPDRSGAAFRGVPFAQPPAGELRWQAPQPVKGWTGVRDAVAPGPPCAQASFGWNRRFAAASKEDCLYLDVWTPHWPVKSRKAVMVWLHGGGNVAGAGGSDPLYDGKALIAHDVVLVVIGYRVGIFGFFSHPELTRESKHYSSGNYGILDQIAALQWVHDNITKFGGDPGNVTIFGQSAGSIDVLALMASPLARGLFHRAIGESGAAVSGGDKATLAAAEQAGVRTAERLKAPADGALRHLRTLSADELLKSQDRVMTGVSGINADGWVFPAAPPEVFAARKEVRVPLILGSNAIEFPAEGSVDELKKRMQGTYSGLAPRAFELYGLTRERESSDPVYGDLGDQVGSDSLRCPVVIEGGWHSAAGIPTWQYQFDRAIPPKTKTAHSADLPYVFGNLYSEGSQAGKYTEADRKLSATMQTYWTNFAKTGDPNGAGVPAWPRFDGSARNYLEFSASADVVVRENQRGAFCDLYRESLK
jgi:para-nitrobenzyl esterase